MRPNPLEAIRAEAERMLREARFLARHRHELCWKNGQMTWSKWKKEWLWWLAGVIGLVGLVGGLGPLIPYKKVTYSVCPISGSMRTHVVWLGCFEGEERVMMPLEKWIKRREPDFEPEWRHLSTNVHFLLGRSFGCSRAPAVHRLRPLQDLLIKNLTEEQLGGLIAVLRKGAEEDQKELVARISEEVLK